LWKSRRLWRETTEFGGKPHSSAALIDPPTPLQQYQSGLAKQKLLSDLQRTTAPAATSARRQRHHGHVGHRDIAAVLLAIGCKLEIRCHVATPLLDLVHPHTSLLPELRSPEQVRLSPDRTYELLSDSAGNRWSRLIASAGVTIFSYEARIELPDSCAPSGSMSWWGLQ
jgi:hypothetical protein